MPFLFFLLLLFLVPLPKTTYYLDNTNKYLPSVPFPCILIVKGERKIPFDSVGFHTVTGLLEISIMELMLQRVSDLYIWWIVGLFLNIVFLDFSQALKLFQVFTVTVFLESSSILSFCIEPQNILVKVHVSCPVSFMIIINR